MDLRTRIGLVFVALGCFLGGMILVGAFGEEIFPAGEYISDPGNSSSLIFTKAGFLYGPQTWRPGYNPLGIHPGQGVLDNETWYLMFVDLNMTPVSGDPNVRKVGFLKITYNFTSLAGRAVFDVYGLGDSTRSTRTNRQTGYNNCTFMVTGNATEGPGMPSAVPMSNSSIRQYRIAISNDLNSDYSAMTATTRTLAFFPPPGSGEAALHITSTMAKRMGTLTETKEQEGEFFVTATGADPGKDILLAVAVDRPQSDDFRLQIQSEFIKMG